MKKKLLSSVSIVALISLTSCGKSAATKIIEYAKLYDRFLTQKVVENPVDHTKASYGYTENNQQGHLNWYYGEYVNAHFSPFVYSAKDGQFAKGDKHLKYANMSGENVARKWVSTYEGLLHIDGKLIANSNSTLMIFINNILAKQVELLEKTNKYIDVQKEVTLGDEVIFLISGDVDFNPAIHFGGKNQELLHYDAAKDTALPFVGDVHPLYVDGQLRNYYLSTNGRYTADMAISDDLVVFKDTDTKTSATKPPPTEGFATRVFEYDGNFYSFYGAYDGFEYSKSSDGYTFENGVELDDNFNVLGQLKIDPRYIWGRDPYAFFDEDIGRYRVISMNYVQDRTQSQLPIIDLALYTSVDKSPHLYQKTALPLINFGSTNVEPEVPMMMKFANRWYLFACMSGRTNNYVGPLSYWIGDENTPIDQVDWNSKQEFLLTGDDLCASQIVEIEGRYYMYGWIPQQAFNSPWGGTINLPQEVYQVEDGKLAVRLDDYLQEKLSKGMISDLADESFITKGEFVKETGYLRTSSLLDGLASLQFKESYDRAILNLKSSNLDENTVIGVELVNGTSVFQVRYSGRSNNIQINRKGVGVTYSKFDIIESNLSSLDMTIVAEGNMLEVFINGRYATCARIDETLNNFQARFYTNKEEIRLDQFNVSKLASKLNFQDNK